MYRVQSNCHDDTTRDGPSVVTDVFPHSLTGNVQQLCVKKNGAYQPLTYPGSALDFALRYGEQNTNPFPERSVVYENGKRQ